MWSIINLNNILTVISRNLFITAGALTSCIAVAIWQKESPSPFIYSTLITSLLGLILWIITKRKINAHTTSRKDAYLTVAISWISICLSGTLPYLFSQSIPSFTNAFFESVSGFTTTGSSILADIEIIPKSILFWRSLTHWIGGIGIIVLVIVIMPTLRIGSYQLFTIESSLQEKIQPKIRSVGIRLFFIYLILTLTEIFLLLFGGMDIFDSICHAFGTISTGGFSPKNTSIAGYSNYIQYVIMIFMFLSGINFVMHYYLLSRNFQKVKVNEELRLYILVIILVGGIITLGLFFQMQKPFELAFRESFFQVISIITCTGFATADYLLWPQYAWVIIFFSMFLGGCMGSTSGGIKITRHLILLKNLYRIFKLLRFPNAIIPIKVNNKPISDESNASVLSFIALYVILFTFGGVILVTLGIDIKTSFSSVATCMAGIGPGIGTIGPASNFAHLPQSAKLILSFFMLLGRLEIYAFLILFSKDFWRK